MRRSLSLLLALALPGWTGAATQGPGVRHVELKVSPVHWRLMDFPQDRLRTGQDFAAVVQGTVQTGWHLYALDEPEDGPVPL